MTAPHRTSPRPPYEPLDFHDPTAGIGGAPAARSALGLRLALAIFGLWVMVVAIVLFAIAGVPIGYIVACAVLGAVAIADIAVVARRIRSERASL
jgi:hypothetical protein